MGNGRLSNNWQLNSHVRWRADGSSSSPQDSRPEELKSDEAQGLTTHTNKGKKEIQPGIPGGKMTGENQDGLESLKTATAPGKEKTVSGYVFIPCNLSGARRSVDIAPVSRAPSLAAHQLPGSILRYLAHI